MYPGCKGDCCYSVVDLQAGAQKHVAMPMHSQEELCVYYRTFCKIMQPLINKGSIGTTECDCIF
jgi:hypothetical protein